MKIYISGKVTGLKHPEYIFDKTEKYLKSLGHEVVNPISLGLSDLSWKEAMIICIDELLKCDTIYMQSNWRDSRGAKIELAYAEKNKLEIIFE